MRSDHGSDAGSLGEFKEANQRYPHVDSLDQPLLSPVGDTAPVYSTYDSHELATQYVLTKITELRKFQKNADLFLEIWRKKLENCEILQFSD